MTGQEAAGEDENRTDFQLLEMARQGDTAAYARLYEMHFQRALGAARVLSGSDAEDVVSEAFVAIWSQLQQGKGPRDSFRAYLLATVRNLSARAYKHSARTLTGVDFSDRYVEDATGQIETEENLRDVVRAFQALPLRWQRVLWYLEVQELPRAEAAQRLHLSPNSTTQLLKRAREGLRSEWLAQRVRASTSHQHSEIISRLPRYVRGGLSGARREEIGEHLLSCTECSRVLAEIRQEGTSLSSRSLAVALMGLTGGAVAASGGSTFLQTSASSGWVATLKHTVIERAYEASSSLRELRAWPVVATALGATGATVAVILLILGARAGSPEAAAPEYLPNAPATAEILEPSPTATPSTPAPTTSTETPEATSEPEPSPTSSAQAPMVVPAESPTEAASVNELYALTAAFTEEPSGTLPPRVAGTADPSSELRLSIAGQEVPVPVSEDGSWSFDMAMLALGAGTHSLSAHQADRRVSSLTFELRLPSAQLISTPDAPSLEVGRGDEASFVRIAGLAGATVCVEFSSGGSAQVDLDDAGAANLSIRHSGELSSALLEFQYCDGSRVGPKGALRIG